MVLGVLLNIEFLTNHSTNLIVMVECDYGFNVKCYYLLITWFCSTNTVSGCSMGTSEFAHYNNNHGYLLCHD